MMRENSSDRPGKSGDGLKPGCEKMVVGATAAYFHIFPVLWRSFRVSLGFSMVKCDARLWSSASRFQSVCEFAVRGWFC